MKKIVIIGPVYPYRGGISHYTALMAKNLNKDNDVEVLSFSMQYPKILYKGEQKEYGSNLFRFDNTTFCIHTLDPFNWRKVVGKIKRLKPDLIIVQWWHVYFAFVYQGILKGVKNMAPVLFICHNVYPHESKVPLKRMLTKKTLKLGSGVIVHSDSEASDLRDLLPDIKYKKTVHPTYNAFKIKGLSKNEARKQLGISNDKHMLLFFGFIRKYKGLKYLINAMPQIVESDPDAVLYIVGDFFENDREAYIDAIEETGCTDSIKLIEGYLPDHEVEPYFASCDVVVLPYISATQSGIVQIAYGFEKPVIATRIGGLPDVIIEGKTGYMVEPRNAGAIAHAVQQYFEEKNKDNFVDEIQAQNELYSWDHMNSIIEDLYKEVTGGK